MKHNLPDPFTTDATRKTLVESTRPSIFSNAGAWRPSQNTHATIAAPRPSPSSSLQSAFMRDTTHTAPTSSYFLRTLYLRCQRATCILTASTENIYDSGRMCASTLTPFLRQVKLEPPASNHSATQCAIQMTDILSIRSSLATPRYQPAQQAFWGRVF